jgi:hypothetical protein
MGYRLEWRLCGRGSALLDSGEMDRDFVDRRSALEGLKDLLLTFPIWGRVEADDYWWARRSSDADLEMRFTVRQHQPLAEEDAPPLWAEARPRRSVSLRA